MSNPQDLAARLVDGMDPQLQAFLRTRVNTFMKWDLVRFFHENPHTLDTAEHIATYTGRDPVLVAPVLKELAAADVLHMVRLTGEDALIVFRLTSDPEMRDLIERFHRACEDRQFRVQAIYTIIRGMG